MFDVPYISYAHDVNLEEQSRMSLQDDELLQHDNNEMHTLKNWLKGSIDMVVTSLVRYDNAHKMVKDLYIKFQKGVEIDWLVFELQVIKTTIETMKLDYLYLLSNWDNILKVAETHVDQLNKERNVIKELNRELKES